MFNSGNHYLMYIYNYFSVQYTDGVDFYNILIHNGDPKVLNFTTGDLGSREGRREKGKCTRSSYLLCSDVS